MFIKSQKTKKYITILLVVSMIYIGAAMCCSNIGAAYTNIVYFWIVGLSIYHFFIVKSPKNILKEKSGFEQHLD
jgi:uncharacterized membrane protein YobD (UPF0266 family)